MALVEHDTTDTEPESPAPTEAEGEARQRAIKGIEARRHFHVEAWIAAVATALLVLIWALSEYHDAGGWPTSGFSQSSGIHDVWNYWIVYPVIGIALMLGGRAWFVYGRKPPSESEIEREMERQRR